MGGRGEGTREGVRECEKEGKGWVVDKRGGGRGNGGEEEMQ